MSLAMLALAISGEMLDLTSLNTWAAVAMAILFAGFWAIFPALILAALLTAAVFWRTSAASRIRNPRNRSLE